MAAASVCNLNMGYSLAKWKTEGKNLLENWQTFARRQRRHIKINETFAFKQLLLLVFLFLLLLLLVAAAVVAVAIIIAAVVAIAFPRFAQRLENYTQITMHNEESFHWEELPSPFDFRFLPHSLRLPLPRPLPPWPHLPLVNG